MNFKLGWSLVIAMNLAAAGGSHPHPASAARKAPKRSIKKIATDLYRYQNNSHFGVFLVTSDGIIMTDPTNKGAARWLKEELKKRFDKPVKYMIYSHDHQDHSSGGEVFSGTATVIAHNNAKEVIV